MCCFCLFISLTWFFNAGLDCLACLLLFTSWHPASSHTSCINDDGKTKEETTSLYYLDRYRCRTKKHGVGHSSSEANGQHHHRLSIAYIITTASNTAITPPHCSPSLSLSSFCLYLAVVFVLASYIFHTFITSLAVDRYPSLVSITITSYQLILTTSTTTN